MRRCVNPDCGADLTGKPAIRGMCKPCYRIHDTRRHNGHPWPEWSLPPRPSAHYQPFVGNPWAGRHPCPFCGSADWTMPYDNADYSWLWRLACCDTDAVLTAAGRLVARQYSGQVLRRGMFDTSPPRLTPVS